MKLSAVSLLAALSGLASAQSVPASNCTGPDAVHFIGIRGHGGGIPPDPNRWNVLVTFRDMLLKQMPGSDAIALDYNYNFPVEPVGIADGGFKLPSYIKNYVSSCPNSKIVLLGFSEGAMVAMNTLCGALQPGLLPYPSIPSSYSKNIVATLLWGDESRTKDQPWNVGSCPQSLPGEFPRWNSGSCTPFGASIQSYCDTGDAYCCYGSKADTGKVHANYVNKYSQTGINFVKQRMAELAAGVNRVVAGTNSPATMVPALPSTAPPDVPTNVPVPTA